MADELKPIKEAPEQIEGIINKVLHHEKHRLYEQRPRGIKDDVVNFIKEAVQ